MENVQITTADLFDLSMLEEMEDNEYLLEMLTTVLDDVPKDLKDMQQALQAGNMDTVCKKAHKLKSSGGIIQADQFTSLLDTIEIMGKKGALNNELAPFVTNAVQQYTEIEKGLKKYITGLK